MNRTAIAVAVVLVFLISRVPLRAQEIPAAKDAEEHASEVRAKAKIDKQEAMAALVAEAVARQDGPQAKVQIMFTEYEGDKKTKSLPYSLLVKVATEGRDGPWSKIRMGSRVPVATGGSKGGGLDFQYIDVGTNIDCSASALTGDRYRLSLMMERSWPETDNISDPRTATNSEARAGDFLKPVIRQFRSDSSVILREGQTLETNFATDPVTGKVIKLEVSLSLVK